MQTLLLEPLRLQDLGAWDWSPSPLRVGCRFRRCASHRAASGRAGALGIRASTVGRQFLRRENFRSRPLTGWIRFPADRLHKAVTEALMPGALVPDEAASQRLGFHHLFESGGNHNRVTGEVRLPGDAERDVPHALALKAHFALWARLFAETDGSPEREVTHTLSAFCDDLGYARLQNGAHRPASRRQAMAVLQLLASLRVHARFEAPNGETARLESAVWNLDLDEAAGTFRFTPGEAMRHPLWRRFNRGVGLASAALLRLRADRDPWTLHACGYLLPLARMNGYRPLTLRVETLLDRIGLLHAERRNPSRMREKLERALDRAVEEGLLGGWDWRGGSEEEPDMDSPAALASLMESGEHWLHRSLILHWPAALTPHRERLARSREQHRRSSRSKRQASP